MTPLGSFIFLRTYSRYLTAQKRRETYKETCQRATEYNTNLVIEHLKSIGYQIDWKQMIHEAQQLFDNMFHLRQFVSGRTMWIGGTEAVRKYSLSNFNCSALNITKWEDLCDLFYLLMVGTGVGFKSNPSLVSMMEKIRVNVHLLHSPYHPLPKHERLEKTSMNALPNGFAKIYIGDSKEGWVESLRCYLKILTQKEYEYIHTIKISYNSVRPRGERLLTFGGTASGPQPLQEMFEGIDRTLKSRLDCWIDPLIPDQYGYAHVRPIHIMDIGNLIGQNVVVGGVRRTSEMVLFDQDDHEILFAKYGINGLYNQEDFRHHLELGHDLDRFGIKPKWFDHMTEQFQRDGYAIRDGLNHRRMSNNSIMFTTKPSKEYLRLLFKIIRREGEPGLINLEEMKRRRPNAELVNPCITEDTLILTDDGPKRVKDLINKQFIAVINNEKYSSTSQGFFKTGTKDVYVLKTIGGHSMRLTGDHPVLVHRDGRSDSEFVPARDLQQSDLIVINNNRLSNQWGNNSEMEIVKGWLLGILIGNGRINNNNSTAYIHIYDYDNGVLVDRIVEYLSRLDNDVNEVNLRHCHSTPTVKYTAEFDRYTITSHQLVHLAIQYGIYNQGRCIAQDSMLSTSSSTLQRAFIAGIFDSYHCDLEITEKGPSICLSSCDQSYITMIQKMLVQLGINSYISMKTSNHMENMLCIVGDNLIIFAEIINPVDTFKYEKLINLLKTSTQPLYQDRFLDKFESLTLNGTMDVYDCTIEGKHCFSADGILVHNCGEVILDTYQTCNLTTVNLCQFVRNDDQNRPYLDEQSLWKAQKLSVRAGLRMTLVTLELPHWDQKQKRDRLIGTSLTGIKDAMDRLSYTKAQEYDLITRLGYLAREEAVRYAKEIRVPAPLLVTTIKPEGTLSQLSGCVSQGLHVSHSPYFIRRVRINATDPMVEVIRKAHWRIHPEIGTPGTTEAERMANARTYVIDFPVSSHAKVTKSDLTIYNQLETYFTYQKIYADHNCSNTITVKPEEWDQLPELIYDHWDDYLGITFIPLDGGHYQLMPYEACTKEVYQDLNEEMQPLDLQMLQDFDRQLYDKGNDEEKDGPEGISLSIPDDQTQQSISDCVGGVCPLH